jgi:hypothetical protein
MDEHPADLIARTIEARTVAITTVADPMRAKPPRAGHGRPLSEGPGGHARWDLPCLFKATVRCHPRSDGALALPSFDGQVGTVTEFKFLADGGAEAIR